MLVLIVSMYGICYVRRCVVNVYVDLTRVLMLRKQVVMLVWVTHMHEERCAHARRSCVRRGWITVVCSRDSI